MLIVSSQWNKLFSLRITLVGILKINEKGNKEAQNFCSLLEPVEICWEKNFYRGNKSMRIWCKISPSPLPHMKSQASRAKRSTSIWKNEDGCAWVLSGQEQEMAKWLLPANGVIQRKAILVHANGGWVIPASTATCPPKLLGQSLCDAISLWDLNWWKKNRCR